MTQEGISFRRVVDAIKRMQGEMSFLHERENGREPFLTGFFFCYFILCTFDDRIDYARARKTKNNSVGGVSAFGSRLHIILHFNGTPGTTMI